MNRLRKGLVAVAAAMALSITSLEAAEPAGAPCEAPACVEVESDAGTVQLSVALAKPAAADAVSGESSAQVSAPHGVFPLSLVAVLFSLIGVVALARRRVGD